MTKPILVKRSGIYKITNKVNSKIYIGSAVRMDYRRNVHRYRLRQGDHDNKHLQAAWNLYGEDSFEFCSLLVCDRSQLLFYEQLCIDHFSPDYNKVPIAGSSLGIKLSNETRRKISLAKKGVSHKNRREKITFSSERRQKCSRPGERHGRARLTEENVVNIRKLLAHGNMYMIDIAKQFNVSYACISDIKYGRSWTHIPCEVTYKSVSELRTGRKWSPKRRATENRRKEVKSL